MQIYLQGLDRFYPSHNIFMKGDQIRKLKNMQNSEEFDSYFVSMLLGVVFDKDVLKVSSAYGKMSNFNKVSHCALDSMKLKFIEGK